MCSNSSYCSNSDYCNDFLTFTLTTSVCSPHRSQSDALKRIIFVRSKSNSITSVQNSSVAPQDTKNLICGFFEFMFSIFLLAHSFTTVGHLNDHQISKLPPNCRGFAPSHRLLCLELFFQDLSLALSF